MIKTEPGRIIIEVGIRFDNVQTVSESVLRHLQDKKVAIFFCKTERYDSSVLAAIFAWLRKAQDDGIDLVFSEVPEEILDLADLYGIQELLSIGQ
jgi:ABC-type transporter Mla MlaB component